MINFRSIKNLSIKLFRYSGLPALVRFLFQRKKVTIIYYHNITPDAFDNHIAFLKKRYSIISLQDYLANRTSHLKYRLIITFDDGHAGNYNLLPVLQKHNIQITIFLTSGLIDTKRHFWFLLKGLDQTTKAKLKTIGDTERLDQLMKMFDFSDTKEYSTAEALGMNQINAMKRFVDFQSHSVTHPCLPLCSDEKSETEIKVSKFQLEELLGTQINSLALPNGDYSKREFAICMDAGYKCVLTADFGFNTNANNNFILKRISTNDTKNIHELALRVTGVWRGFKNIRNSIKR